MPTKSRQRRLEQERKNDEPRRTRDYRVDRAWQGYVAGLAPDDQRGAFLLPDELPAPGAAPADVIWAITTATRRAFIGAAGPEPGGEQPARHSLAARAARAILRLFLPRVQIVVRGYQPGILTGRLRMLLPQGREVAIDFESEPGWRADVVLHKDSGPFEGVLYYRSLCLNPVRAAAMQGAEIDSSQVFFQPLDGGQLQAILEQQGQSRMTAMAARRLQAEYQWYRRRYLSEDF